MAYEILVGLNVVDDNKYNDYRSAMKPILINYQGQFGYDFKVSDVLVSPLNSDINRVFTLSFNSKNNMDNFFSDPHYLLVKEQYFTASVSSATIIASYEKTLNS
jgi:uncharacterized protein (DUF1330 family)